jgi:hypothetical protein
MIEARLDLDFGHNEIDHGTSDDYYTPSYIFDALGLDYEMDVCSPPGGCPWIPAKRFLSIIDDGLETQWHGRVWMNPPYSNTTPWINKWMAHGNGMGLVLMSKSKWFTNLWNNPDITIMAMDHKLKFMTPAGDSKAIFMPTVLIAIGSENVEAMAKSGLGLLR